MRPAFERFHHVATLAKVAGAVVILWREAAGLKRGGVRRGIVCLAAGETVRDRSANLPRAGGKRQTSPSPRVGPTNAGHLGRIRVGHGLGALAPPVCPVTRVKVFRRWDGNEWRGKWAAVSGNRRTRMALALVPQRLSVLGNHEYKCKCMTELIENQGFL